MKVSPDLFIHPQDKANYDAFEESKILKLIWKFYAKKVMSDADINAFVKGNSIRVSETVMPWLYDELLDVCKKLDLDEIPEMYVMETSGWMSSMSADKNYIIFGNALFDNMPAEFYPTIIARECGHILCGHVKFRTICTFILQLINTSTSGIVKVFATTLTMTMNKYLAAGELTADRAAILYNEGTDKLYEMIYRMAGAHNARVEQSYIDGFVSQAEESNTDLIEYKGLKKLARMGYYDMSKKMASERIIEAKKWIESDDFKSVMDCIKNENAKKRPIPESHKKILGKNAELVIQKIKEHGLDNLVIIEEETNKKKSGTIIEMKIAGDSEFEKGQWVEPNAVIEITVAKEPVKK